MPMDGFALACAADEMSRLLTGGRVEKIAQPERDEICLSVRADKTTYKLLLTANASSPRAHITEINKPNPMTAPMFCMVLRKHLSGGRLLNICQPDFERILEFTFEARGEMGDLAAKKLVIEIMGKHSNIMLLDETGKILDSIKHIPRDLSSVREVLPGRMYAKPPSGDKVNPLEINSGEFSRILSREDKKGQKIQQLIYQSFNGVSPVTASEICERADIAPDAYAGALDAPAMTRLFNGFSGVMDMVRNRAFSCRLYAGETSRPADACAFPYIIYNGRDAAAFDSPSAMLEAFYRKRDAEYRLNQRTADLRKLVSGHMERCVKKRILHDKTLDEVKNRERLRLYGELLTAYIYMIEKGAEHFTAVNFHDGGAELDIPLDANLTPAENAQSYYKQYNKQKRAHAALQEQMKQNEQDIIYLDSVLTALQTVSDESDIAEIRAELAGQGFIKRPRGGGKPNKKAARPAVSKPLRFTSSDGYEIYVGKNNTQNDELTLRFANNADLWLHTKDIAGSHVIVKTNGAEPPERTVREAANLAAYYSKGRGSSQVPVDYVIRKYVRKPNGAKPGFVIYDRHKTAYITPEEPSASAVKLKE